ncbi:MAG: hypothetical protein GEU75_06600 [Dehalococcoidia bacterium]|nr:hypothetical protein [Dehalococcoidia bacterium]
MPEAETASRRRAIAPRWARCSWGMGGVYGQDAAYRQKPRIGFVSQALRSPKISKSLPSGKSYTSQAMQTVMDDLLSEFIDLGRRIIAWDRRAALGFDFQRIAVNAPSVGLAQPGFMGTEYKGLVVLGLNPGNGDNRLSRTGFQPKWQEWHEVLAKWRDSGTTAAYEKAFQCWLDDLREWRVWSMYVQPLLNQLGFTPRNIAYLNLFQSPTIANASLTPRMIRTGWPWTKAQLDVLKPRAVVAGGKRVGDILAGLWPNPPFEVIIQDRNRSLSTVAQQVWVRQAAARLQHIAEG